MSAVAVPAGEVDEGVTWHYGDPHVEQRELAAGRGAVDLSNRGVVHVTGPDRLSWLHSLTTAHLESLAPGESRQALILSPHGHVEHDLHLFDDGSTTWISVEPGSVDSLCAYLDSMRFMLRVEVVDRSSDYGVVYEPQDEAATDPTYLLPKSYSLPDSLDRYVPVRPGELRGREVFLPRDQIAVRVAASGAPAGTWALSALRVAAGVPRLGADTDHRTIPHEVGWVPGAVHLDKGCYRGQETVARVHNLGRPPRRLVLLHLDGSHDEMTATGDIVFAAEQQVGRVGTVAWHHELGPIALALVKRSLPVDAPLLAGSTPASQEPVVLP